MADVSYRQEMYLRDQDNKGQDLQQKGQEAVESFKHFLHDKAPSPTNVVALVTILPLGAFLLGLSGLALMASLFGLAVTTPVFLLFSPVLVPAVLTIGLAVLGFLTSGACGITGLSAFSWIINYLRGYQAHDSNVGLENVSQWAHDKVGNVGQRVKEMGQNVTDRARHQ